MLNNYKIYIWPKISSQKMLNKCVKQVVSPEITHIQVTLNGSIPVTAERLEGESKQFV